MALPIFEEFLYPFLLATSKKDMTISEMREYIVDYFHLTEEDCSLRTKSGNTTQVADRLIWVRQYLRRALMMARSIKRYLEYNVNAAAKFYVDKFNLSAQDAIQYLLAI